MIVRPRQEVADLGRCCSLRHDPYEVVGNLEKPAFDMKTLGSRASADPQLATAEEGDHWRVSGEDAHLAVERWGDDRLRVALEEHCFR